MAKAALESTSRYLARYLGPPEGVRSNLVAAGPIDTLAKKAIPPGSADFNTIWGERAPPLGWDATSNEATAKAVVALLSDWFPPATSGRSSTSTAACTHGA